MKKILFVIGISLLLLNCSRFIFSYRDKAIEKEFGVPPISETMRQIDRFPNESSEQYVRRLSILIQKSIYHYWDTDGKYDIDIPIWDNYILYGVRLGSKFGWEYLEYRKALERGLGLCSQRAMTTVAILEKNHIQAECIALHGHVVLRALISPDQWVVVDPSSGIVIPYNLDDIKSNVHLIDSYYPEPQFFYNMYQSATISSHGVIGFYSYNPTVLKLYYLERLSYVFIWIIPIILILPFFLIKVRNKF